MLKAKIGVTPSLQSPKKDCKGNNTTDKIQLKIREYEIKLSKLRDDIFKLEVERVQILNNNQKTAANSILENIEKKDQQYELFQKKYELSENLVQSFQKILSLYPNKSPKQNLVKSDTEKNLPSANNLITKPNVFKQTNDISKLNIKLQKTQTPAYSRIQLKKKLELYQNKHFIKTIIPLEEKERKEKNEYIIELERDLKILEKINQRLLNRFGTNSNVRISSQLNYGRKINEDLKERYNAVKEQFNKLTKEIRQYENNINMMSNPLHYARLIKEGEIYKQNANKQINDLLKEASERVTFGQRIFSAIQRISSLIDPNRISSGLSITELQWIKQKLAKKLNKNISLKSISSIWDMTKSSLLQTTDDTLNISSSFLDLNDESISVPEIPISSIMQDSQSFGNTRKTRRLFSALNSLRTIQEDKQGYDYSLETVGRLLGNVFVDRFSPIFHQNNYIITIKETELLRIPKPISKIADLPSLLSLYIKYKSDLYLTQIENEEIQILDPDFLYFTSEKEFFKENLKFSNEEFLEFISNSLDENNNEKLNQNLIPYLWMIHDFSPKEISMQLLQILTPIYNSNRKHFLSNSYESITWAALFSTFFESNIENVKYTLLLLYDSIFVRTLEKFVPSYAESVQSKCSILALLRYGKHFPKEFLSFIDLKNNSLTSFVHKFILCNSMLPTFIQVAIEFTNATFFLLDEEPLIWHTSLFYHFLINELVIEPIRIKYVKSYLSIICSIIEHRSSFATSLFQRLYILFFLKKNFELEEICSETQNGFNKKIDSNEFNSMDKDNLNQLELNKANNNELNKNDDSNIIDDYYNEYDYEEEEEHFDLSPIESQNDLKSDIPFIPLISLGSKNPIQKTNTDSSEIQIPPILNPTPNIPSINTNSIKQPPLINLNSIKSNTDGDSIDKPSLINLNSIKQSNANADSINQPLLINLNSIKSNTDGDSIIDEPVNFPKISLSTLNIKTSGSNSSISYHDITNSLPNSLDFENPKLQLHFQQSNTDLIRTSVSFTNMDYMKQRKMYPIYITQEVHYLFFRMIFALLIDHSTHRFDVVFVDPFPFVNRKPNILFTLMQHMESSANEELKTILFEHFQNIKETSIPKINFFLNPIQKFDDDEFIYEPPQIRRDMTQNKTNDDNKISLNSIPPSLGLTVPKFIEKSNFIARNDSITNNEFDFLKMKIDIADSKRLTKLTMPCLFNSKNYLNGKHIANGAFGSVIVVPHVKTKELLAVKILKKSKNEYDNPHLFEVFTEVSILEILQNDRRVTQLKDYGCKSNSYYIIMEYYPTTMKSWRKKNNHASIKTMLRLYREFLKACTVLVDKKINHYDIKCDNVMIDKNGYPCLADFGEAMSYTNEKNCFTMLNKGTEWIKSPEMLSIALNSTITNPNFDRRKKIGAGPESDIWSIGCLFYELITGEFLFMESNWSHFFRRITEKDQILILPENRKKLSSDKRFCAFLEFVLQRNCRSRPNLHQVISKFDEMFPEAMKSPLPYIEIPKFE